MGGYGQGVADAMLGGFEQGADLRQQRKDQDFQNTANQLFNNRSVLQQKVASLRDANGNPLPGYDDAVNDLAANETAIREHWHPVNNPGMLQKFGHMITDHLGITDPNQRAQQQVQQQQKLLQGDQTAAQNLASATPLSPAQTAMMGIKTQGQVQQAQLEQDVANWRKVNPQATPQQEAQFRKELTDSLLLGRRWNPLYDRGKWEVVQGTRTRDGKPFSYVHDLYWNRNTDLNGNDLDPEELQDFVPTAKTGVGSRPPTSAFGITLAAYARAHGTTPDKLPYDAVRYVESMMAQDKLFPTATTSNVLKQDVSGRWVPITETNTKTPGARKLTDPLGPASSNWIADTNTSLQSENTGTVGAPAGQVSTMMPTPPAGTAPPPTTPPAGTQPTPQDLRREAQQRNPKAPASTQGGGGNPRVGAPLLQGRTPASDAAFKALDTARGAYEEVQRAAHSTNPVDSQGIILSWLRGKVNRVTATEIAAVRNLGGVFDKFDGTVSSIEHGTMTRKQMSWFVKNAKDNLAVAQKVASQYTNPNANGGGNGGNNAEGGGFDWSKAPVHGPGS